MEIVVVSIILAIGILVVNYRVDKAALGLAGEIRTCRNQIEHLMSQDDGIALAWDLNYQDKIHTYEYKNACIEVRQKVGEPGIPLSLVLHMSLREAENKLNELRAKQHDDCMNLSDKEQKIIWESRESLWDNDHVIMRKSEVAAMKSKQKKGKRK